MTQLINLTLAPRHGLTIKHSTCYTKQIMKLGNTLLVHENEHVVSPLITEKQNSPIFSFLIKLSVFCRMLIWTGFDEGVCTAGRHLIAEFQHRRK